MKPSTVTETDIQAAADTLLAEGRAGTVRPTVSALAARAGITRPTLYRNYPALIDKFLTEAATATIQRATRSRPGGNDQLNERITKLRTGNPATAPASRPLRGTHPPHHHRKRQTPHRTQPHRRSNHHQSQQPR
ncbi:TetR/AcrR family transcriptional regulator [Amycolatopsis panacis]|uniref:TetR/AcrR family transcriptional regulator n=1 Tax=Amycolatopsis panacis TaxID=2340917 RepID=UPI0011C3781E|nr:TetR/AcrR family transcriptional regulator [Amycolatopsis panacis]